MSVKMMTREECKRTETGTTVPPVVQTSMHLCVLAWLQIVLLQEKMRRIALPDSVRKSMISLLKLEERLIPLLCEKWNLQEQLKQAGMDNSVSPCQRAVNCNQIKFELAALECKLFVCRYSYDEVCFTSGKRNSPRIKFLELHGEMDDAEFALESSISDLRVAQFVPTKQFKNLLSCQSAQAIKEIEKDREDRKDRYRIVDAVNSGVIKTRDLTKVLAYLSEIDLQIEGQMNELSSIPESCMLREVWSHSTRDEDDVGRLSIEGIKEGLCKMTVYRAK